ncbi:MAG: GNAT family N-acetyltransferase [Rhodobiaceae bacterium]|nr:GNAT family N-acetyltransferase [Rhodobiaceae bacterium]MCC0057445.1 GNAT family N-acetyltransferase [Rhodobiaceae bacterium]
MALAHGFHDVEDGDIALVVTYLQMKSAPSRPAPPPPPGLVLDRVLRPDVGANRALYRRIGEEWLWFSRLRQDDQALAALLGHPRYETYELRRDGTAVGLLELDLRDGANVEIAFFGLVPGLIGQGAGAFMIGRALDLAWRRGTRRVWLHTCTADHPRAVEFYVSWGFVPYRRQVEVTVDPRLDGTLKASAAGRLPMLVRPADQP